MSYNKENFKILGRRIQHLYNVRRWFNLDLSDWDTPSADSKTTFVAVYAIEMAFSFSFHELTSLFVLHASL